MAAALAAWVGVALTMAGEPRLGADGIEYLSIARSLAAGEGFTLGVKWHFLHSHPPPLPAMSERPPLYPLLLATGVGPVVLQALLAAASALMLFALLRPRAGPLVAWSGLALVLGTGPTWSCLVRPLPDLLFLALLLGSGLAVGLLSGVLLGLSALARPEGLLLAVPAAFRPHGRVLLLLAAGLASLPLAFADLPSMFTLHLRVRDLAEGMWLGYGRTFEGPPAAEVARRVVELELGGLERWCYLLGPLVVAPFALLRAEVRARVDPVWPLLAAQGLLSLVLSHAVWSVGAPYDPKFYLVPVVLWGGAALAVIGAWRPWVAAACVALLVVLQTPVRQEALRGPDPLAFRLYQQSAPVRWLARNVGTGTVAAASPWSVHHATGLPTVILPFGLSRAEMHRFLLEYDVRAVVFNHGPAGGEPPPDPEGMPWLEPVGMDVWEVDRRALLRE